MLLLFLPVSLPELELSLDSVLLLFIAHQSLEVFAKLIQLLLRHVGVPKGQQMLLDLISPKGKARHNGLQMSQPFLFWICPWPALAPLAYFFKFDAFDVLNCFANGLGIPKIEGSLQKRENSNCPNFRKWAYWTGYTKAQIAR